MEVWTKWENVSSLNRIEPPSAHSETNWNRIPLNRIEPPKPTETVFNCHSSFGNQQDITVFLLGAYGMVHYSIYGSLPRYVEQLTHSQHKLDGSLSIKTYVWSPSLLNSINSLQSYTINQSEQSLEVTYEKKNECETRKTSTTISQTQVASMAGGMIHLASKF